MELVKGEGSALFVGVDKNTHTGELTLVSSTHLPDTHPDPLFSPVGAQMPESEHEILAGAGAGSRQHAFGKTGERKL